MYGCMGRSDTMRDSAAITALNGDFAWATPGEVCVGLVNENCVEQLNSSMML
jgi:hypothetical protein